MTIKAGDKLTVIVGEVIITTNVVAVRDQLPFGVNDPSLPAEPDEGWYDVGFLVNDRTEPERAFKALKPKPCDFSMWAKKGDPR